MGRFLLLVYLVGSMSHIGHAEDNEECEDLLNSVLKYRGTMIDFMIAMDSSEHILARKEYILSRYAVDVDDDDAIKQVVCDALDAESVEELVDALGVRPDSVKQRYLENYETVEELIFSPSFSPSAMKDIQATIQTHFFCEDTGFPDFPLDISYREAERALRKLPEESNLFPENADTEAGIEMYANAMAGADTLEEFAEMTDSEFFLKSYETVEKAYDEKIAAMFAVNDLVYRATKYGIMDLPRTIPE